MDNRAQVSVEYLILATFAIIVAIAAALFLDTLRGVALTSQANIISYRNKTIGSLLG